MTLTSIAYFNRPAYQLGNDRLSLTVVPGLSARVMVLTYDGQNCLWNNDLLLSGQAGGDASFGNWLNWGGYKTWLAPQDRWPNPAAQSSLMDNVTWEVVSSSETVIELLGPLIPWGGVRLGRRLALAAGQARVQVTESICNDSGAPQTWSVWAVAQFPVPGWATYPPSNSRHTMVPPAQKFDGDRLRFQGDSKWKVGALTEAGWGAYRADAWQWSFRANFAAHPALVHPDGASLETWSNSDPGYMELEWLGPLLTLQPGQRWEFETEWVVE